MISKLQYLIGFILLLALGLSELYLSKNGNDLTADSLRDPGVPEHFMEDVTATQMNTSGQKQYRLHSPRMDFYPRNSTINYQTPNIIFFNNDGLPPWHISAQHGRSRWGFHAVYLWDEVMLQQAASGESPATKITTSTLSIYPNNHYAETSHPIQLMRPDSTINAVGMRTSLDTHIIHLLSDVRGSYQLAKKKQRGDHTG